MPLSVKPIDTFAFRLHYKYTAPIFFSSALLVLIRLLFKPIDCVGASDGQIIQSTCGERRSSGHPDYYHWMWPTLLFSGLLFLLTRSFWKSCANNVMRPLIKDLYRALPIKKKDEQMQSLVNKFIERFHKNSGYAYRFYACEVINFVYALGQFCLIDLYLDRKFKWYGWQVLTRDWRMEDPMNNVFPKVSTCSFTSFKYYTGRIDTDQVDCHLNINFFLDKLYFFIWLWMVFLITISGLEIIRIIIRSLFGYKIMVWCIPPSERKEKLAQPLYKVVNLCNSEDALLLDHIYENMDPGYFNEFIGEVNAKLEAKDNAEKI